MGAKDSADTGLLSERYLERLRGALPDRSRILLVADGAIVAQPDQAPPAISRADFGVSNFVASLRRFSSATLGFEVTLATRNGEPERPTGFDLYGFRFDAATLARYDQVWLFGFDPGNAAPESQDIALDTLIVDGTAPLSDAEHEALAQWMENGGGVFAAGDHHLLGATMCFRVPRVSTMRLWSIEQGVPTRYGKDRLDTGRPATVRQMAGLDEIDGDRDAVPQPIEWVAHSFRADGPASAQARPHPLLCHPTLGPIDVLPDHSHEGRCYVYDESWRHAFSGAQYGFGGGEARNLYPASATGEQPLPQVVAWGTTLASPPLSFGWGVQPARRFPLIGAYDGEVAGVGRVVVDSTWHHWFDGNMAGVEQLAVQTGVRDNLEKIRRYHVNVAIWLAPRRWRLGLLATHLKLAQFEYFGQEAFHAGDPAGRIGRAAAAFLNPLVGPCWVTAGVLDLIGELAPGVVPDIGVPPDGGPRDLPLDDLVHAALGGMVRALYGDMAELSAQLRRHGAVRESPLLERLPEVAREGTREGLREGLAEWRERLGRASAACDRIEAALPREAR